MLSLQLILGVARFRFFYFDIFLKGLSKLFIAFRGDCEQYVNAS